MGDNRCRVLIIDGQGGRIGKQLAEAIGQDPRIELTAAGTNSAATVNMMKGCLLYTSRLNRRAREI